MLKSIYRFKKKAIREKIFNMNQVMLVCNQKYHGKSFKMTYEEIRIGGFTTRNYFIKITEYESLVLHVLN